jgi:arylsulfatase A-like enzyme
MPRGLRTWIDDTRQHMLETIRSLDREIGRLVAVLRATGRLDRTVIVFTSDNGYHFGEHRWRGKQTPYEPSVHVPLVIRVPGSEGRTEDELVANIDLAPTIAELAGASLGDVSGISMAPSLTGGSMPSRDGVALTWEGSAGVPSWSALRLDDAVYIRNSEGVEEYYDLGTDPNQLNNSFAGLSKSQVSHLRLALATILIRGRARE